MSRICYIQYILLYCNLDNLSIGGKWVLNLPPASKNVSSRAGPLPDPNSLDGYWLETLLLLIGEGFEEPFADDVCGAVVQLRPRRMRSILSLKVTQLVFCCILSSIILRSIIFISQRTV